MILAKWAAWEVHCVHTNCYYCWFQHSALCTHKLLLLLISALCTVYTQTVTTVDFSSLRSWLRKMEISDTDRFVADKS